MDEGLVRLLLERLSLLSGFAPRLVKEIVSSTASSQKTSSTSSSTSSKNGKKEKETYWAKGTGFGFGEAVTGVNEIVQEVVMTLISNYQPQSVDPSIPNTSGEATERTSQEGKKTNERAEDSQRVYRFCDDRWFSVVNRDL